VFTKHFVAFNRYARYQYAPDRELADRYLLQEALFPTPPAAIDRTYNLVFGLSAGNAAARTRNACIVSHFLSGTWRDCTTDIRAHIAHQEVLALLDQSQPDIIGLLRKYSVDTIVTMSPLPGEVSTHCTQMQKIGPYTIHACRFSQ
jgi:hypothetical protein